MQTEIERFERKLFVGNFAVGLLKPGAGCKLSFSTIATPS